MGTEYESDVCDMFENVCRSGAAGARSMEKVLTVHRYVYLDNDTYNHFRLQTEAVKAFEHLTSFTSRKLRAMTGSRISVQGVRFAAGLLPFPILTLSCRSRRPYRASFSRRTTARPSSAPFSKEAMARTLTPSLHTSSRR